MKIVAISDTHGKHKKVLLPEGDMLIHAGDISGKGRQWEIVEFLKWFARQPHPHKIFIAGNHDFFFEQAPWKEIKPLIPDNVHYLKDNGITIEGMNIWGSPITPWFYDWAFNRQPGADIQKHWNLIPQNTDILITHGPVYNILDRTTSDKNAGCPDLLEKVMEIQPQMHITGHIHEAYGCEYINGTRFINASILDEHYLVKNAPVVIEI
ncbi:metallophosphatase domain-containing protein [Chitinophagaceae bacterium MMS25-I14]